MIFRNNIEGNIQNTIMAAHAANSGNPVLADLEAAQAILESRLAGNKPSDLALESKNLFGIKGSGTAGSKKYSTNEVVGGVTQKVMADFAVNKTIADSFQQHSSLIQRKYPDAANAKSFEEAARGLRAGQQGGYATDPNYAKKLIDIYKQNILPQKRQLIAEGKIDDAGHYLGSDTQFALNNTNGIIDRVAYKVKDWEIFQKRDGSMNGWTMTALGGIAASLGLSFFNRDDTREEKGFWASLGSGIASLAILGGVAGFFISKFTSKDEPRHDGNMAKANIPTDGTALASTNKDKQNTDLAALNLPKNKDRLPSKNIDGHPTVNVAAAPAQKNAGGGGFGVAPAG